MGSYPTVGQQPIRAYLTVGYQPIRAYLTVDLATFLLEVRAPFLKRQAREKKTQYRLLWVGGGEAISLLNASTNMHILKLC